MTSTNAPGLIDNRPPAEDPILPPPTVSRIPAASRLREAESDLALQQSVIASMGNIDSPLPKESFEQWQIRRDKVAHAHEESARLKDLVANLRLEVEIEDRQRRAAMVLAAHVHFEQEVEAYLHAAKHLQELRVRVEEANRGLPRSRLPNDWYFTNYIPGTGMLPPAQLGLTLKGTVFHPRPY